MKRTWIISDFSCLHFSSLAEKSLNFAVAFFKILPDKEFMMISSVSKVRSKNLWTKF